MARNKARKKRLADLVREGTFRADHHARLLEDQTLNGGPEDLRTLQALYRDAAGRIERRALALCFGRIVRARAR